MTMKKIIKTIKENKTFLISTHVSPDPDALCSELAMAIYLKSIGKKVHILNNEDVPQRYCFLPGTKQVKVYKENLRLKYDVAIILDCGDFERIGRVVECIDQAKPVINIDHHITNTFFGNINLVEPKASSTGEVLYNLFKTAKCKFTDHLALHLYAGIMTDTGSFRFENTTPTTLRIVSELLTYKFSAPQLYRMFYEMLPLNDMAAFTKVISNFDIHYKGKVVSIILKKQTVEKFSEDFDLRDTIFKFLRSIKGIEVFVICTEVSRRETRINLRSSVRVNVAKIAGKFDGGGHKRASGCKINDGMKKAHSIILKEIGKSL